MVIKKCSAKTKKKRNLTNYVYILLEGFAKLVVYFFYDFKSIDRREKGGDAWFIICRFKVSCVVSVVGYS
ncbi:hypothetical protein L6452_13912 [Arctium lappa]|uniref:Uncharacterized protein n=1 Tax=Arctium lappa TaxID=4217 RepID=A0ACB9CJG6_ARCLA|nr:hypothetical protein L6452_13912 [Arctium lappa]